MEQPLDDNETEDPSILDPFGPDSLESELAPPEPIQQEEAAFGVSPALVDAVIQAESAGKSYATSPVGAKGLMQLMDATGEAQFKKLGLEGEYDPYNAEQNKILGTAELRDLSDKYQGDTELTLAAYNYGQGNVDKLLKKYGNSFEDIQPYLPSETKNYVDKVTGNLSEETQQGTESKLPQIDVESLPNNSQGFADALLTLTAAPEFEDLSLAEKAQAIKDVYSSKFWGNEADKIVQDVITNYIDAASPEERPNYAEIIGPAPFLEPGEDNDKALRAWREEVSQRLINDKINPSFLGNQFTEALDAAVETEQSAYTARNRTALGWAANQGANLARDVLKGAAAGGASVIAAAPRLLGYEETANTIQDLPEYLGKPANDYLYETDENGYLKLNPDNTPIPRWQSQAAQITGQIGAFIAGGAALKIAGFGATAIKSTLLGANTLTMANESFRTVYDQTKDSGKAYTAAFLSLPAAAIGAAGEYAVVAKWANPAISKMSDFNKAKYLGQVFARNAAVGGVTNVASDAVMQAGEISQTGQPFDNGRAYISLGAGALASGTLATLGAAGAKPQPIEVDTTPGTPTKLPATEETVPKAKEPIDGFEVKISKGTPEEQGALVGMLEDFQKSDDTALKLSTEQADSIPENLLPTYAVDIVPEGDGVNVVKRETYVPVDSEELVSIDKLIGDLNKSLAFDESPNSITALERERATLKAKLHNQTIRADKETLGLIDERRALERAVTERKKVLDDQTDSILKKVAFAELEDARAALQTFDDTADQKWKLYEHIGETQDRLDVLNSKLKNASRDTYANDIKAKERNLKNLLRKRKAIIKELQAAQEKEIAKTVEKPKDGKILAAKEKSAEQLMAEAKPVLDFTIGVRAKDNYIYPAGQKWFVFNKQGELLGNGKAYYADAQAVAEGKGPVQQLRTTEAASIPVRQETTEPSVPAARASAEIPAAAQEGSTVGAQYAGKLKEMKTGERLRLSPALDETIREGFSGDNELLYFPQSHERTSQLARDFIDYYGGFEKAVTELLARPDTYVSAENTAATQYVIEGLNSAVKAAKKAGDMGAARQYADLAIELADKRSRQLNSGGQGIEAAKMWAQFDPTTFILGTKKKLRATATAKKAKELGVPEEQLTRKEASLSRIKDKIKAEEARPESDDRTKEIKKLKAEEEKITDDLSDLKRSQEGAEAALTEKQEEQIKELFNVAKKTGGSFQQNVLAEAFKIRDEALNKVGAARSDTWYSLWQANILSDVSTQIANIIGNTSALIGSFASYATTAIPAGKFDAGAFLQGMVNGATKQGFDAAMLELQGIKTYKPTADKFLNTAVGQGKKDYVEAAPAWMKKIGLNNVGYVFRALSAVDAFFYKTSQEGMAKLAAYDEGLKKGLKDADLQKYVADTLYNASEHWDNAYAKAKEEASYVKEALPKQASERAIRQRAWEILEANRPESIRTESQLFASRNTFSNKPEGVAGLIIEGIQKLSSFEVSVPFTDKKIQPFRYYFPFMNVAGNILNASLDYTPVGLYRATKAPGFSALERRNIAGKFIIGSALSGTVYSIGMQFLNDKDPAFAIYGEGPENYNKFAQWKAAGGKPYSIKIGDTYYNYRDTPLGILLGGMGAIFDEMRYNPSFEKSSGVDAIGILLGGAGEAFVSNSFLKSLGDFVNAIQGKNSEGYPSKRALIDTVLLNPVKGFVPAAGTLKMISRLVDDPVDTSADFYSRLVKGIPFVQSMGTRPALNAFGEPLPSGGLLERFVTTAKDDPAWKFLGSKGYTIPDFGTTVATTPKRIKTERTENLGPAFADVLTPDERYLVIERAGPQIRKVVEEYAKRYGDKEYSEAIQKALKDEIIAIRSKIKRQVILGD